MYHPYFRGKQYELITVRENASLLASLGFVPIIEPVKESLGSLERALKAVCEAKGKAVVIVNPHHGDHSEGGDGISSFLRDGFLKEPGISAGILLKNGMTVDEVLACCDEHSDHAITFVHAGFTGAKALARRLDGKLSDTRHIFFEENSDKLYRKHFFGNEWVLLRDGFQRQRNQDYPLVERFSDLHVTFRDEGVLGSNPRNFRNPGKSIV